MLHILSIALLIALLTGCSSTPRPDLARLYAMRTVEYDQPPVILIPGSFGTRLRDPQSGKEVWPGNLGDILFSRYEQLALSIDPVTLDPLPGALEPAGIADQAAGREFYAQIMRTLENFGGYRRSNPGSPTVTGERRYYILAYDWRQDIVQSSRQLDQLVRQVQADYGNPELKVDILAHSMGALVTRYYLRYGTEDVLDNNDFPVNYEGARHVRRAIMVGAPNLGSIAALQHILDGLQVGLQRIPTEVLITFPGAYQLLPHPIRSWLVTVDGRTLDRDLFDIETWRRFQWSVFAPETQQRIASRFDNQAEADAYLDLLERFFAKHIERARRFVWSLTVPAPQMSLQLVVFGGDCILTPARILVEEVKGESLVRLYPQQISHPVDGVDYEQLMLEPGDGSVTKASLLARDALDPSVPRHRWSYFPVDYAVMFCEEHPQLTSNINFQNNLLNILLSRDE